MRIRSYTLQLCIYYTSITGICFSSNIFPLCVSYPMYYKYVFLIQCITSLCFLSNVLQVCVSYPMYYKYVFLIQCITSLCFLSNVLQVCVSYPMYYRCTFVSDPTNYVFQFYMPYPIYHNNVFLIIRFNLQLCVTGIIISNLKVK